MSKQLDIHAINNRTADLSDDLRACLHAIDILNSGIALQDLPLQEDHFRGFDKSAELLHERYQQLSIECLQAQYRGNVDFASTLQLFLKLQGIVFERLAPFADAPEVSNETLAKKIMLEKVAEEITNTSNALDARQYMIEIYAAGLQKIDALPSEDDPNSITERCKELEHRITAEISDFEYEAIQIEIAALACESLGNLIAAGIDKINTEIGDLAYSARVGIECLPEEIEGKKKILEGTLREASGLLKQAANYMAAIIRHNQTQGFRPAGAALS